MIRHLLAIRGQVWVPEAALARWALRRQVLSCVLLLDLCAVVLAAVGSGIALLVVLALTLVALPIAVRALRQGQFFAFVDRRTGLVGVEDGLPRAVPTRRR